MNTLSNKKRIAVVGTGHRGSGTWGQEIQHELDEMVDIVGLCDTNPMRLDVVAGKLAGTPRATTDYDQLLREAQPHTVVVCTRDDTHADIIVEALERGCDVITEKPMCTTAEDCRRILDAEARTGRKVNVAFNYRFAPTSRKIREIIASGRLGKITSVDFHWYLDTKHGADYFRRWHAYRRHSGSLFVHKATHHFDLLNWWLDSDPRQINAQGKLAKYGAAGPYRGERCKTCPHKHDCFFFLDLEKDPYLTELYEAPSQCDGYYRDGCVFREDIDIWDTMTAEIEYENDVIVSYSLNAFMPIEGFHLAVNGTEGRMEIRMYERQAFDAPHGKDEIVILGIDRSVERIIVEHGDGGHFGGDPLLHRSLFDPEIEDAMGQRAGARAGAMSVLTGVAAAHSVDLGRPVAIKPLLDE